MNIDVVSATVNDRNQIEVVKEFTDNGNVTYGLHVIPRNAIINNAALEGIEDAKDAIDFILYKPHVDVDDEGTTILDKVRSAKARVSDAANRSQREANRKANLTRAGVHERYHPVEGMDPIEEIRAAGRVTTETIQEAKTRLTQKEGSHDNQPGKQSSSTEQRTPEDGRTQPRRAYISLGTTD